MEIATPTSPVPVRRKVPLVVTIFESFESVFMALILAIVIRTYVVQAFKIPTCSMEPTLHGNPVYGDKILVNKFAYLLHPPARGDIFVFHTRGIAGLDQEKDYIKRMVGLPGDEVLIRYGEVYIDGRILREPYVFNKIEYFNTAPTEGPWGVKNKPVLVPPDSYYALGDNSGNSRDSRYWGFVPARNVKGKAFMIWAPVQRWSLLRKNDQKAPPPPTP